MYEKLPERLKKDGRFCLWKYAMTISEDLHAAMFSVAAYTVILAFSLFKTGSLSKSI